LWSWIKETCVPHARACARSPRWVEAEAEAMGVTRRDETSGRCGRSDGRTWCVAGRELGLKTDGNFLVFSRSVFYILSPRFRIFGKSGIQTKSGMEVVEIRTEVETTFFRPYFWNPGFHRNCSVFNPECLPNLNRPTKGGPRREGTHLKKP
jgi:hypothetical protein